MKKDLAELDFKTGAMLLVHKPYGWTSFGIVTQLKKWTKAKIGHAGTLDPLASGLIICCTGSWTKKLTALTGLDKEYTGTIFLGARTDTYDLESLPYDFRDISLLSAEDIETARQKFSGRIQQVPPVHSAIKQNGTPVYELARKGKEVIIKSREVDIKEIEFDSSSLPDLHFRVVCSSGTYIRSLAFDIGETLGCGAYLKSLCRTAIGEYRINDAYSINELSAFFGSTMNARIISPKAAGNAQ